MDWEDFRKRGTDAAPVSALVESYVTVITEVSARP